MSDIGAWEAVCTPWELVAVGSLPIRRPRYSPNNVDRAYARVNVREEVSE